MVSAQDSFCDQRLIRDESYLLEVDGANRPPCIAIRERTNESISNGTLRQSPSLPTRTIQEQPKQTTDALVNFL